MNEVAIEHFRQLLVGLTGINNPDLSTLGQVGKNQFVGKERFTRAGFGCDHQVFVGITVVKRQTHELAVAGNQRCMIGPGPLPFPKHRQDHSRLLGCHGLVAE
ncbi:Uncharacterised protein [Vibrio cholerae]|uniref:Uncharacterized protein n=1 Tax=Vibrio cholerae TaxID=666 RepID=A0A656AWC1_VIBCL|nr:Uncharacterised protein [Vibrio cholerae]